MELTKFTARKSNSTFEQWRSFLNDVYPDDTHIVYLRSFYNNDFTPYQTVLNSSFW